MAIPAWFWPQGDQAAITVAGALSPSGILLADRHHDTFYRFDGTFGPTISGVATFRPGGSAATAGASGDIWVSAFSGPLSRIPNGAAPIETAMPAGNIYVGVTYANPTAYVVTSSGDLLNQTGAAVGPGFGTAPAWGLSAGTSLAYTALPALSEIGTFALSGGATGTISLPAVIATPYVLAASGTNLAVAGTANTTLVSGAAQTAFALNPANPAVLLGVASGLATVWLGDAVNSWTFSTQLSGVGTTANTAWVPSGVQALVTTGIAVDVLGYSASVLSLAQTLAVSGAGAVVAIPTGTDALVVQSGLNQLQPLVGAAGTWSLGTPISGVAGAGPAVLVTPTQVAVGVTDGIQFLNLVGGVWSFGTPVSLAFTPLRLAVDPQGILYAASNGQLAVVNGGVVTGTGSWTGDAGGLLVVAQQVAIPDQTVNEIRIFGSDNGTAWTQRNTVAIPAGFTGIGQAGQTIFSAGAASTQLYNFGAPYMLKAVPTGSAGFWNGTSWVTAPLGIGQVPGALTIDPSGNAEVACTSNNLYVVTSGGAVTASEVPQYAGQTQAVPLGTSALIVSGSSLFAATSMAGVLVQIR